MALNSPYRFLFKPGDGLATVLTDTSDNSQPSEKRLIATLTKSKYYFDCLIQALFCVG